MDAANTIVETARIKTLSTLVVNRFQPPSAWLWSAVLIAISLVGVVGTSAVPGLETPVALASNSSVQVAAGDRHTCILDAGAVKCWGYNDDGELGLGDTDARGDDVGEMGDNLSSVDLGVGVTATAISAGDYHTCALTSVGVKCWGYNDDGELGLGDTDARGDDVGEMGDNLSSVDLGVGVTATAISAGGYHTCALTSVGVKCWGYNGDGELGLGDTDARGDGVGEMGDNLSSVDLGVGVTATAISAGGYHTCALTSVGVKCWGRNTDGQLGLGDTDARGDDVGEMGDNLSSVDLGVGVTATAISAGDYHTCALTSVGVKCWGYNTDGQLGLGDTDARGDDVGEMGDNLSSVDLGVGVTATATSAGAYHTCALTSVGVKCWGYNGDGELGLGDTDTRGDEDGEMGDELLAVDLGVGVTATVIAAGAYHTCALLSSGAVKCWGLNDVGQLGLGDMNNRGWRQFGIMENLTAANLGDGVTATAIATGEHHTCALTSVGVQCWGRNTDGQLGSGDFLQSTSPPIGAVNLGTSVTATAIAAGFKHTCALTSVGVKCWGVNSDGQLGNGNRITSAIPVSVNLGDGVTATAIAAGNSHTCALTSVGVKCWGKSSYGQLGYGNTNRLTSPPINAVDLGAGVTATAISAGGDHTCALTSVGVKCWGYNAQGHLGLGDTNNRGNGAGQMGDNLLSVDLGDGVTVTAIAAGFRHTCALTSVGVKCWGYNAQGQLGLGDTGARGDGVGAMGGALPAFDLGAGVTATAISARGHHTCALTSVGVKCWGYNFDGELGLGATDTRGDEDGEMGDNLLSVDLGDGVTVTAIAAGFRHTCALTSIGVKCWGNNSYGQLGLGSTLSHGGPTTDMGDTLPTSYVIQALSTPTTPTVTSVVTVTPITVTPITVTPITVTPITVTPTTKVVPTVTIRSSQVPGKGRMVRITKVPPARVASAAGMKVSMRSISLALARPVVAPSLRPAAYSVSLVFVNGGVISTRSLLPAGATKLTATVFNYLPSGSYRAIVLAIDADGRRIGQWKSPHVQVKNKGK